MVEQRQSEMLSRAAAREAAQISTMMADLARIVEALNSDIAAEEQRARISDPANFAYPVMARTWSQRRDNLETTLSVLATRLEIAREKSAGFNP